MTLESKNYFGFDLIYIWSNISIYFHQYVVKCPLTSCISIRLQMSGITVAGYLTSVLGRIGRLDLNQLVSWYGPSFQK